MLWPDSTESEHEQEGARLLAETERSTVLVASSSQGGIIGFAEAAIRRDYVNGCDASPVLFLEGIYVMPAMRRQGIAKALCASIEQWGASRGCLEFASDTSSENADAQALHRALGFDETERVVFFRKRTGGAV
jgi:aminoglycoside 6'-N-acetyltransferase I